MNSESFLKRGMMEHQLKSLFLERNGETSVKEHTHSREPSATQQDTNINLIIFRLNKQKKKKKNTMNFRERSHSNMEHEIFSENKKTHTFFLEIEVEMMKRVTQ